MSILRSVRESCDLMPDCEDFDRELIKHTNTVFLTTRQLGLGPPTGMSVTSELDTWDSIFGENLRRFDLDAVKTYIGLQVRLVFDPPTSQALLTAINNEIAKLEWRLNVQVETPPMVEEE